MRNFSPRAAAVVLAGGALAVAGIVPAFAASSTPGWRVAATYSVSGGSSILSGVDAVARRDAWSIGVSLKNTSNGIHSVVRHWNGRAWTAVKLPARVASTWNRQTPVLAQIGASSTTNVWAFNELPGGQYLRLNGNHWTTGKLPGNNNTVGNLVTVTSEHVFSTTNVWAFGAKVNVSTATPTAVPYAAHFNGSKWTVESVPGTGAIVAVGAASAGNLWAVIGSPSATSIGLPAPSAPTVLNWTANTGWQQAAVQPALPTGANLTSIVARGATVTVGGSAPNSAKGTTALSAKFASGASAWTVTNFPGAPTTAKWNLDSMTPDGHGGLWGVLAASNRGTEHLWHLHGTAWSQVHPNFGTHPWILTQLSTVPGTGSVWAVGATKRGTAADGLIAIDGPMPR